jgi:hypothetical protein
MLGLGVGRILMYWPRLILMGAGLGWDLSPGVGVSVVLGCWIILVIKVWEVFVVGVIVSVHVPYDCGESYTRVFIVVFYPLFTLLLFSG